MSRPKFALRTLLAVSLAATVAFAAEWEVYRSDEYGFSMMLPAGTRLVEREKSDGWGFLYAQHDGIEFYALARLGPPATAADIEKVGVRVSKIADRHWKAIDKGEHHNGWTWWRTAEASDGHIIVFAGYGTGPRGSYLCFVKTTEEDYAKNKAEYRGWYESVKLVPTPGPGTGQNRRLRVPVRSLSESRGRGRWVAGGADT